MSYIFNSVPFRSSQYTQRSNFDNALNLANVYQPSNGFDDMDIVNKFNWTLTPINTTTAKEVPYIRLREYYLLDSYLNQLFKAYGRSIDSPTAITNAFLNPFTLNGSRALLYQGLYDHVNPTGFTYKFPYFTSEYLSTNNSWTSRAMFQEVVRLQKLVTGYGVSSFILGGGVAAAGVLAGAGAVAAATGIGAPAAAALFGAATFTLKTVAPVAQVSKSIAERALELQKFLNVAEMGTQSGIGGFEDPAIDKPHIWSTTTPRSFNITFPLYNITTQPVGKQWYANILKNWELCHLLCYQNLYNKRNLFTGIPPVFYEIDIPGVHYSKAGYISNLQILNSGNIRKLTLPIESGNKEVNVPDAYIVNMTVTDFFIPSKNFMSSLCTTNKGRLTSSNYQTEVIEPPTDAAQRQEEVTPDGGPMGPRQPGEF
jgi:hypothetical protein